MAEEKAKKNEVFDFNKPLLNLDGTTYKESVRFEDGTIKTTEFTVGSMLGTLIWQSASQEGRGLKLMGWSRKLYAGEPLTLDEADQKEMKEWLKKSKPPVFVEGQSLEILDGLR